MLNNCSKTKKIPLILCRRGGRAADGAGFENQLDFYATGDKIRGYIFREVDKRMKNPWINKTRTKKGTVLYRVWYWDGSKQISKNFQDKKIAEHYKKILYYKLNADVFVGVVKVDFDFAREAYLEHYRLEGLTDSAKEQAAYTLDRLADICGKVNPHQLTNSQIHNFISARLNQNVSRWTINKDLSNLRSFINWCVLNRYIIDPPRIRMLKTPPPVVNALTIDDVKRLIRAADTPSWQWVIILSVVTGLRKNDIDRLELSNLDIAGKNIVGLATKTKKPYALPLPQNLIKPLVDYCSALRGNRLFLLKNKEVQWRRIREAAGLDCTRQDLRRTCSTLLQSALVGQDIAQGLLQHSDKKTTASFYTGGGLSRLVVEYVFGGVDWWG